MIVLGVDPGTAITGWGVIERRGNRLHCVGAGVIKASRHRPLEQRLLAMHDGLEAVIREHKPDEFAVEDVFQGRYASAALKLGHVRGVVLLLAARAGIAVHAYPPAVVKNTVAGRGRAPKEQVAQLVGAILGLSELPSVDATDALAVAITHAQAAPGLAR